MYLIYSANEYTHVFGGDPSSGVLTPHIAGCFSRCLQISHFFLESSLKLDTVPVMTSCQWNLHLTEVSSCRDQMSPNSEMMPINTC